MTDPFEGLPRRHFGVVLADCPWRFKTYNEKGRSRCPDWRRFKGSPARHYETMSTMQLCMLPVRDLLAEDVCLFLWISWPMLEDALKVMTFWGFQYKTCAFSWMKARSQTNLFPDESEALMGPGYWTRSNSEVCLLGTHGKPKRKSRAVRQGIIEPRREHSRKPDCVRERIEQLVDGPYLELFSRQPRAGWTTWGNETDKFKEAAE